MIDKRQMTVVFLHVAWERETEREGEDTVTTIVDLTVLLNSPNGVRTDLILSGLMTNIKINK